jgi:hypothetical protein
MLAALYAMSRASTTRNACSTRKTGGEVLEAVLYDLQGGGRLDRRQTLQTEQLALHVLDIVAGGREHVRAVGRVPHPGAHPQRRSARYRDVRLWVEAEHSASMTVPVGRHTRRTL